MRINRCVKAACLVVAVLAGPVQVGAQGRRGGGMGAGASGQPRTSAPPVQMRGMGGGMADTRIGESRSGPARLGAPGLKAGTDSRFGAQTRIESNSVLSARAARLLPPGSEVGAAASGFRNETEFLAAAHASAGLGIPFGDLKREMQRDRGQGLDKAIRSLRPDLDKKEVKRRVKDAETMARSDVRQASGDHGREGFDRSSRTAEEIRLNRGLGARVVELLPEGVSLDQASSGFRNTGQFVAALQVSRNLSIPFGDLRARMIAGRESLGEAIRMLRPAMPESEIEAQVRAASDAARELTRMEAAASSQSTTNQKEQ
jgi:hypothetical protein